MLLSAAAAFPAKEPQWLRVSAPEFTVITTLSEKEAVAWAGEFAQFIGALQGFIPVNPQRLPRLTIVVFGREREFADYRPLGDDIKVQEVAGFFARRDSWAVAGLAKNDWNERTKATIFHEGTHWFLSAFELPNPVWLEEGLAEVFSTFAIGKKKISWGRAIEDHVMVLNELPPMPLEKLLFISEGSLFTGGEEGAVRTGMAYAQSWAFVHYLMFGQNDAPRGAMMAYVRALRTATHPDEAFRQAFGQDYATMDEKLRRYLRGGRYYVAERPPATLAELRAEPASVADVEDALARLCLGGRRMGEALAHANHVLAAAGDSAVPFELLGQVHLERGNRPMAQAAFEQAVARKSLDFRPYYEIARARHAGSAQPDGSLGDVSPVEARKIANGYERAINLNARYRPAYEGLAGVVELTPAGNPQDLAFLQQGVLLFPDNGMIRLGLAVVEKRDGDATKAAMLLNEVLESEKPQPVHVRNYAHRLETAWLERDVFGQTDALVKEKKFAEALALLDQRAAENNTLRFLRRVRVTRQNIQNTQRLEVVREAWEGRQWTEVRRLINEILESDASPVLKAQMRRRLDDLDRRGLGKPKE
ncbi:DUF1570 domain-containing protein [Opitutus terrae]|uniref:DUF1570 domain-containing protein n=1 Tax=Opitutus terrae (strain DSM 11246 / JCM 15787 / PB90-1) TaxID=452637 RepID=B1ZX91_OPITP|nr:DUF1570 domain-containing protein [Opitutus terrae]ACB76143.1 hypothetical protein Oter_2862 [Opitutus terrae PB90-1]